MYKIITQSVIAILMTLIYPTAKAEMLSSLQQKTWIHGAKDCTQDQSPAIEVYQYNADSFILRQNKCVHYEAPFIYVLFGSHTVFIQDTGATAEADQFPLYDTIKQLITQRKQQGLKLLVTHSHSHGDHKAGDVQFIGKPDTTVVLPTAEAVKKHFGFDDWPHGESKVDLGGRELSLFPIPGHQAESVAVYDPQTQWLLTGDTFYPGRLYIKDWTVFKNSIQKLLGITEQYEVSALMGTHIEMKQQTGKDYPMGSTYQPNEASLPLSVDDLKQLNHSLIKAGNQPKRVTLDKFIIYPLGN